MHIKTGQEREKGKERGRPRFSYFWLYALNGILAPFQFTCEHKRTDTGHSYTKDTHTHTLAHSTAAAAAEQERVKLPLAAFYTWRLTGATGSH